MQINESTLAALFKGYRTIYLEAFHGAKISWDQVAMRTPSGAAEEIYHWLGAIPGMKELVGSIVIENLSASKYSIVNKEFESTVGVKQADIERDSYGIYNPLFSALGMAARQHQDEIAANLLINGFATLDYTGKNFFDTNKKHEASGRNTFTNKATAVLSATSFEAGRTAIKSVKNEKNRPMNLGQKLLLVVSPKNESTGRQILQADFVQQTAQNVARTENVGAAGVTNVNKGTAELLIWPQLSAQPDYWFLLEVGYPVKPLILQVEKEPALASLTNPQSDHVFKNHEFLYQAYGRYNGGYGLPQLAYGSNGTT